MIVELRFLGQPFGEHEQIGRSLTRLLDDAASEKLWLATAWAKRSGLSRIAHSIRSLRERGGVAEAVIGVDEGGASLEGLQLASELFEPAYVFHDPGPRTFHPKLYVVERQGSATVLLGSGNLTKGGLFTNYEAAVEITLAPDVDADRDVLEAVRAYFDALVASGDACQALTTDLIQHLSEIAVISSEAAQNRGLSRRRAVKRATRFGDAISGLAGAPVPQIEPAPDDEADEDIAARLPAPDEEPDDDVPSVVIEPQGVVAMWWKRLSASDAQHPPAVNSAVTGNLRLSKAGHPIDWRTYFRRDFFGTEDWQERTVSGRPAEEVTLVFRVVIDGEDVGDVPLRIDHAPHREADQNNVPTVLHWGDLSAQLRATNYTDFYVVIEKSDDGEYSLGIARAAPSRIDEP